MKGRSLLGVALTATTLGLITGCGLSSSPSALNGNLANGSSGGISVYPDQPADYTAFTQNVSGETVTLRSATLVTVPGFRAPRLVHVAVEPGLDFIAAGRGWPVTSNLTRPFPGYRVRAGNRLNIAYAVIADQPGDYADGGIKVTIEVGGTTQSLAILSGGATCVFPRTRRLSQCSNSFNNRAEAAMTAQSKSY